MRYRSDKDSLGSVKIPTDAYYGPFTGRAVKQYHVTGQKPHIYLIKSFVMIKRSAAIANMKTKTLDRKRGNAIVKACDKILAGKYQDEFVVDMINSGAGTAFNMNTNEVIANVALRILGKKLGQYKFLHPNDHVNMSQSSNDTYPTAMNMSTLFALNTLLPIISKLTKSLAKKAKQFSKYKKIGRTHLMDALPVTLGSEFDAYVTSITKSSHAIIHSKKQLEQVALGGTAVGTGANSPKRYRKIAIQELAKISKLGLVEQKNMQHSLQSKFAIANTSSAIRNFAVELGKISNDIRLMASGPIAGLGELEIPAVHAGSSIMPGKVNPSLAECMNMICFSIIGNDTTVAFAAQAGQLELNVMLPVMIKAILDSTDMLTNFLPIFSANLIDGLVSNKKRLQSNIEKSPVIVTLLAPKLGYQKSAELFKESVKTKKTIRDLVISKKLMTKKQVDSLLK
ncbi:Aspartate ammonia-lyase protein [Marine Group I thaumarchaeote SCGC AAA799-O18]|nr:Aspartate ammonia-lyase protein [Marine Group I thaumarchaeote SCGC AAA799-O18]